MTNMRYECYLHRWWHFSEKNSVERTRSCKTDNYLVVLFSLVFAAEIKKIWISRVFYVSSCSTGCTLFLVLWIICTPLYWSVTRLDSHIQKVQIMNKDQGSQEQDCLPLYFFLGLPMNPIDLNWAWDVQAYWEFHQLRWGHKIKYEL